MHPLIENNRETIAGLYRRHGVQKLEAFGSVLREAGSFANYLQLKESLEAVLSKPVDLLELHAIRNRRLRYYIEQSRSSIYAAA